MSCNALSPAPSGLTRPPLRYHGGKFRMARHILRHFPPHRTYVEPCGGGAGLLLAKPTPGPGCTEVYNDADGSLVAFFRVLRDPAQRRRLQDLLAWTPFARAEFEAAYEPTDDDVEAARRLLIRSHQGFGSAAATREHRTGWRGGAVRSRTAPVDDWRRIGEVLEAAGQRLRHTYIEGPMDAAECIARHAHRAEALVYLDPPYVMEARNAESACYAFEMDEAGHRRLAAAAHEAAGRGAHVVVSGYASELYDRDLYADWPRVEFAARANGRAGTVERTEVLWLSPSAAAHAPAPSLFAHV